MYRIVRLAQTKTARNMYWSFFGNGAYTVLTFVFVVLISARFLGPTEFGRFSALFSFAVLLAELVDMGIGPSLSRFVPPLVHAHKYARARAVVKAAFSFVFFAAVVVAVVVIAAGSTLGAAVFDDTPAHLVRLTSFGVVGTELFIFSVFALSAYERFAFVALINIVLASIRLMIAILFIAIGQFSVFTALISLFVPTYILWAFSHWLIPDRYLLAATTKKRLFQVLSFSKYVGANKVFTAISTRIDVIMLIALAGAFESGIYSAAVRITQVYPLVAGSLLAVFAPRFSVYHTVGQAWDFTKKAFGVAALLVVSIVVFFIIARPFITAVFGAEYISSIPVFQALLLPMVFFILQLPISGLVIYTLKKPEIFAIAGAVQVLAIIVGNLIFIPQFGVFGPVIGLTIGYAAALFVLIAGVVRNWKIENHTRV